MDDRPRIPCHSLLVCFWDMLTLLHYALECVILTIACSIPENHVTLQRRTDCCWCIKRNVLQTNACRACFLSVEMAIMACNVSTFTERSFTPRRQELWGASTMSSMRTGIFLSQ